MFLRRVPEWVRHAPVPSVKGFALLQGLEAAARGILISAFPVLMYRSYRDAVLVSELFFAIGVFSLIWGLFVPWLIDRFPRRYVFTAGGFMFLVGAIAGTMAPVKFVALALLLTNVGVITMFICYNAYVLDFIAKAELGQVETLRLFYSAIAWCVGPALGVWLMNYSERLPFAISAFAAILLLCLFWYMRLGDGKLLTKQRHPSRNPLAYILQFSKQPRLVAGWTFAVVRSCAWWVYVVYLPIFAVKNGLGEQVGGIALSITNGILFATPIMLKWMQKHSIKHAVRVGFAYSGLLFIIATFTAELPWIALAGLFLGSTFLILLDISAGLPFLMAVRPAQRTEMSAIYATYRDVSGILTPGAAWLVLLVAPVSGVFAASGAALIMAWHLAGHMHPRLGQKRHKAT